LSRKYGMTVDNLISADVVTADGKQIRASATENPDLFWGLRGGGGNFGVVTSFEFQLHPVGPNVLSGLIVYPFAQAKAVLMQFARFTETMPDELNVWMVTRKAPPLPFLPAETHGKEMVALALCYAGDPATGEKLIAPLRTFGTPIGEHVGVQPYTAWQQAFDPLLAPGARNYWKSHNFSQLSEGVIDAIVKYAAALPSPQCEIFIGTIGGQTTRVAADAMAYSSRDAKYVMNVHGRWETAAEDERGIAWAREFFAKSHRLRLRRHLPAARRHQAEVRPNEPVPHEPEHQAVSVEPITWKVRASRRTIATKKANGPTGQRANRLAGARGHWSSRPFV
jgi:FAD/FMN-containing dehydrogenase